MTIPVDVDVLKWIASLVGSAIATTSGFLIWLFRWRKSERAEEQAELAIEREERVQLEERLSAQVNTMSRDNEKARAASQDELRRITARLERGNIRMTKMESVLKHLPTHEQITVISKEIASIKASQKATEASSSLIHEFLLKGGSK